MYAVGQGSPRHTGRRPAQQHALLVYSDGTVRGWVWGLAVTLLIAAVPLWNSVTGHGARVRKAQEHCIVAESRSPRGFQIGDCGTPRLPTPPNR
jgi:hypothetical protein